MVRHIGKKGSKRLSCHKRYKILRKVREHNRQARRETRKNNKLNKKRGKKTKPITIPRNCPFKENVLDEAALVKQGLAEEREQVKEGRKSVREKKVADKAKAEAVATDQPASVSSSDASDVESNANGEPTPEGRSVTRFNAAFKAYSRDLKSVIAESDIILEVLDARDPQGTRNHEVERRIIDSGSQKRIILVLNKVDLVPVPVARKWLAYLRQELPTIALKANAQALSKIGSTNKFKGLPKKRAVTTGNGTDTRQIEWLMAARQCDGAESLMQLVRNYARAKQTVGDPSNAVQSETTNQPTADVSVNAKPKSVTIGVIGYPSVGKRSVIDCLRRERSNVAGVKPKVNVTRALRAVQLDRNTRLIESPGNILDSAPQADANAILRNALEAEFIHQTTGMVKAIAAKLGLPKLAEHYRVTWAQTDTAKESTPQRVSEFLNALAHRSGLLKKGGVPDSLAAARRITEDWQAGSIHYFSPPPSPRETAPNEKLLSLLARDLGVETVYPVSDRNLFFTTKDETDSTDADSQQQTVTS